MFILLQLVVCLGLIFFAGRMVARGGDIIAEKTGLGGLWIGFILISISTSLPELFTGVASSLMGMPELSIGNLFGANTYNLSNLAILSLFYRKGSLFGSISKGHVLSAIVSVVPLSIAAIAIISANNNFDPAFLNISLFSYAIFAAFLFCSWLVYKSETKQGIDEKIEQGIEQVFKYKETTLGSALTLFITGAVLIIGAGVWLSYLGDAISAMFGLGRSFIGSLVLGFATTLPEITVSAAAIQLGALDLAVGNMLGSNLFNLNIIFFNDLLYRKGSVFSNLGPGNLVMAITVGLMTAVLLFALLNKPGKKMRRAGNIFAILLIVLFLAGMFLNFLKSRS